MLLPSSLNLLGVRLERSPTARLGNLDLASLWMWMVVSLRLAEDAWPVVVFAVAILTRPTLVALFHPPDQAIASAIVYPGRALFPSGDGETHVRRSVRTTVRDGPSLRSQTPTRPCVLSTARAGDDHPHPVPFWCARSASKGVNQPIRPTPLSICSALLGSRSAPTSLLPHASKGCNAGRL